MVQTHHHKKKVMSLSQGDYPEHGNGVTTKSAC